MLPKRPSQVRFEVSRDAVATIRERGGQLWIWPGPDKSQAYATTEPPGERREWTSHQQAGFVVHTDDAIVPPERWVVARPTAESRHLLARWSGAGPPETSERLPLVDPPDQAPIATDRSRWFERVFGGSAPFGAWVFASVLGIVGIRLGRFERESLWEGLAVLVALLVIGIRGVWRRIRRA